MIHHAGIAKISTDTLQGREFELEKFDGHQLNPRTGEQDAIYMEDLLEAIAERAGPNSTVLHELQFVYMEQEQLEILKDKRKAIVATGTQASSKEMEFAMKIADSLNKANKAQTDNNEKSRACLVILKSFITAAVCTIVTTITKKYPGQEQVQLKQCIDKIRETYHVTPNQIKRGFELEISRIGIASTYPEVLTLTTALILQQQRQQRSLTKENPNLVQYREGLLRIQDAIDTHAAALLAWAQAANLLPGAQLPPAIAPLSLPYPCPAAGQLLGAYNANCAMFQHNLQIARPRKLRIPDDLMPVEPEPRCLLDPTVQLKTNFDWLELLRNKTDSDVSSVVYVLRQRIIDALDKIPVPSLDTVVAELAKYIARNPVSDNHSHAAVQAALATVGHRAHTNAAMVSSAMGTANYAMEGSQSWLPQIQAIGVANLAYGGSQSIAMHEVALMSDAELGAKRRAEIMAGPQRTTKCHFWGWQNGALQCGKTMITGHPCTFAQYHNLDHQGGPMQKYGVPSAGPPVAGGQSL
jgi:hypothetical protein